jgi:hypothetical protein
MIGLLCLTACTGYEIAAVHGDMPGAPPLPGIGPGGGNSSAPCAVPAGPLVRTPLTRLTLDQYQNSLEDLFGLSLAQRLSEEHETVALDPPYATLLQGIAEAAITQALADAHSPLLRCGAAANPSVFTEPISDPNVQFTTAGDDKANITAGGGGDWLTILIPTGALPHDADQVVLHASATSADGSPAQITMSLYDVPSPSGPVEVHSGLAVATAATAVMLSHAYAAGQGYWVGVHLDNADGTRALKVTALELVSTSAPAQTAACALDNLLAFAPLAYRRPLATDERQQLGDLLSGLASDGDAFSDLVHDGLLALLSSPQFLFRPEVAPASATDVFALDGYQLATRLSYFLWEGPPDDTLAQLAASGALTSPAMVREQVMRMLQDPRALRFSDAFADRWLGSSRVLSSQAVTRDGLTDALRGSILQETRLLLRSVITENRSPRTLVGADYTFVDGALAQLYGIDTLMTGDFMRVSTAGTRRTGGLLSEANYLTQNASTSDSRPVARGHIVLEDITCTPPPPRPPGVPPLPSADGGTPQTVRDLLAEHTTNPACAACHVSMDAIGLGLENYDQLGRWRDAYANGTPIDASGALLAQSFTTPDQMFTILASSPDVPRCIAHFAMGDALGRVMTADEACEVNTAADGTAAGSMADLIIALVTGPSFLMNRVTEN